MAKPDREKRIHEFDLKMQFVDAVLHVPANKKPEYENVRQKLLQEINVYRDINNKSDNLTRVLLADFLGYPANQFNEWRKCGRSRPAIGKFLDYCSLTGIGPTQQDLEKLSHRYHMSRSLETVPDILYNILDLWRGDTPNYMCWIALAGTPEQLDHGRELLFPNLDAEKFKEFKPSGSWEARGLSAEAFMAIYDRECDNLEFSLLSQAHWLDGFPSRGTKRYSQNVAASPISEQLPIFVPCPTIEQESPNSIEILNDIFDQEWPDIPRSPYNSREKLVLYGGRHRSDGQGWTAIEYVSAGYAFQREQSVKIAQLIAHADTGFTSHTITALPGCGLSLTLAQIVEALVSETDIQTFWILDDPERTRHAILELPEELSDVLHQNLVPFVTDRRVVFVIDDVSLCAPREIQRLIALMTDCKRKAQAIPGLKVSFVLGSKGDEGSEEQGYLEGDDLHQLALLDADQKACYTSMASDVPRIIHGDPDHLDGLLAKHPYETSWRDDPQAFIDYLLRYGNATREALDHWIVDTAMRTPVVVAVAKSQMLGLTFQESVAKRFFQALGKNELQNISQIAAVSDVLYESTAEWRGVGLACAWRARTILAATNELDQTCLTNHYADLIRMSLQHFQEGPVEPERALEYGRHILQRLASRKKRYWFPGIRDVAERVLALVLNEITRSAKQWSGSSNAKWAGTLSSLLYRSNKSTPDFALNRKHLATVVAHMCQRWFKEFRSDNVLEPDAFVPLCKAINRLYKSNLLAPKQMQQIHASINNLVKKEDIKNLLVKLDNYDSSEKDYRANEIVHCYIELIYSPIRRLPYSRRKELLLDLNQWWSEMESLFGDLNISFDAQNWLLRARCTWIDSAKSDRRTQIGTHPGQEFRAYALRRARASVSANPRQQGQWNAEVEKNIRWFIKNSPAFAEQF